MAVLWGKAFVHGKQCDWGHSQKYPQGVHQVDLNPECHNDGEDTNVVKCKHEAPETQHGEVSLASVYLSHVV